MNLAASIVSGSQTTAIIFCITCITAIGNLLAGLLTVCIPVIALDIDIPQNLQLWPAAAFALACGCTLLPLSATADVLGCRRACLAGALLQTASAGIVLLCVAFALLPAFALWMRRQIRLGRPALIPNTLWTNTPFTTVCFVVFMVWGSLNASEQLTALYLQDVLRKPVLRASLYFLPAPVCGILMNVGVGFLIPYMRPSVAVPIACLVSGLAPLLLATICRVDGPSYWRGVFQAMALNPVGADLIYVIANLVLTEAFPEETQALAGGIFNMLAQIGKSVGIATTTIIARQLTAQAARPESRDALLTGYKAGWFYNCALASISALVSLWGLYSVKHLGVKRE
ncbi:hypothetical protein E4T49_07148 [Aureobasidium sp. EXF-10728]|nr:hypothetical protein E4T49_07148 [Aureobasidium sp. EXF-10728]